MGMGLSYIKDNGTVLKFQCVTFYVIALGIRSPKPFKPCSNF